MAIHSRSADDFFRLYADSVERTTGRPPTKGAMAQFRVLAEVAAARAAHAPELSEVGESFFNPAVLRWARWRRKGAAPASAVALGPTSRHLVEAEFSRRAAAVEVTADSSLVHEAIQLSRWLGQAHPDAAPMGPRAIEIALRKAFLPPKPRKRPGIS